MSVGTGRQNIICNSVLEITVSFPGIQKWEPGIYIGFSQALHLQCTTTNINGLFNFFSMLTGTTQLYRRICSFASYSSHPIRKFIWKPWLIGDEYGVDRIACLPALVGRRSNNTCEYGFLSLEFFSDCSEKKLKGWFLGLDKQDCFLTPLSFSFCG